MVSSASRLQSAVGPSVTGINNAEATQLCSSLTTCLCCVQADHKCTSAYNYNDCRSRLFTWKSTLLMWLMSKVGLLISALWFYSLGSAGSGTLARRRVFQRRGLTMILWLRASNNLEWLWCSRRAVETVKYLCAAGLDCRVCQSVIFLFLIIIITSMSCFHVGTGNQFLFPPLWYFQRHQMYLQTLYYPYFRLLLSTTGFSEAHAHD